MTAENFVYWLQGYLELTQTNGLTETQLQIVKDHIEIVLTKVTPNRSLTPPTLIDYSITCGLVNPSPGLYSPDGAIC